MVASFAIYLIPLFHLEAGWLSLGKTLSGIGEVTAMSLAWILSVLILQGIAFLAVFLLVTRFGWRTILLFVVAIPLFVLGANMVLLWWIPFYFLVERDTAPDLGSLEPVCSIPGASLAQVSAGADLSLVRAGEAWLVTGDGTRRMLLRMPGCGLVPLNGRFENSTIDAVAPGGRVLHRQINGTIGYLDPASEDFEPQTLHDKVSYWKPILSDDGRALIWLDRARSEGSRVQTRLYLRERVTGDVRILPVAPTGSDQIELLGARSIDGPFTLAQFRNVIFAIDAGGGVLSGPVSPDGIYDARWGFVWLEGGWIAWDGYREDGRSRIVWNIAAGRGMKTIPLGQSIDSLTVAANGRLIAVSVSGNLRLGDAKGSVFAFRTDTGREVYRRRSPVHFRSAVAFLRTEYLAVTEPDAQRSVVRVYRVRLVASD